MSNQTDINLAQLKQELSRLHKQYCVPLGIELIAFDPEGAEELTSSQVERPPFTAPNGGIFIHSAARIWPA